MNKKLLKLGFFVVTLFIVMWSSVIPVSAGNGDYRWFVTGDGKWDGKFTARSGNNVTVYINDWNPKDTLSVRLCRVGGGCTRYKVVTYDKNYTTFTNMAAGTYHGDVIRTAGPSKRVTGYIGFRVY